MALVKRRVSNPSPAILTLVNGGKKMATRKRKSSTRRPVRRTAAANPPRRRKATVKSRRNVSLFKPRRRRARVGTRRRNPIGGGIVGEAINFAVAGFAIGAAQPIIARFVPNFGTFTVPVTSVATGFGLGWLAGLANFTRPFKRPLQIMGFALAITTLAGPLVRQIMGSVGSGMSGPRRRGMRGIAAVHGIPPLVVPPPLPPANNANANGMQGIAARPGNWAY